MNVLEGRKNAYFVTMRQLAAISSTLQQTTGSANRNAGRFKG